MVVGPRPLIDVQIRVFSNDRYVVRNAEITHIQLAFLKGEHGCAFVAYDKQLDFVHFSWGAMISGELLQNDFLLGNIFGDFEGAASHGRFRLLTVIGSEFFHGLLTDNRTRPPGRQFGQESRDRDTLRSTSPRTDWESQFDRPRLSTRLPWAPCSWGP